jgi:hypothetical protein
MDEERIHEPDNGTQFWDRGGFDHQGQMPYNPAYPSTSGGFAWSMQTNNEVLSYAYSPQAASDAMPPAPNPFQPALSPSMLSLRFAAPSRQMPQLRSVSHTKRLIMLRIPRHRTVHFLLNPRSEIPKHGPQHVVLRYHN